LPHGQWNVTVSLPASYLSDQCPIVSRCCCLRPPLSSCLPYALCITVSACSSALVAYTLWLPIIAILHDYAPVFSSDLWLGRCHYVCEGRGARLGASWAPTPRTWCVLMRPLFTIVSSGNTHNV